MTHGHWKARPSKRLTYSPGQTVPCIAARMAGPTYGPKIHLHCYTLGTGDTSHILDPRRRSGRPSASPHGRTVTGACNNPPEGVVGAGHVAIPEDAGQTRRQRSAHRDKAASKYHCTEATKHLKRGRRAQKVDPPRGRPIRRKPRPGPTQRRPRAAIRRSPRRATRRTTSNTRQREGKRNPNGRSGYQAITPEGNDRTTGHWPECRRGRKDHMRSTGQ